MEKKTYAQDRIYVQLQSDHSLEIVIQVNEGEGVSLVSGLKQKLDASRILLNQYLIDQEFTHLLQMEYDLYNLYDIDHIIKKYEAYPYKLALHQIVNVAGDWWRNRLATPDIQDESLLLQIFKIVIIGRYTNQKINNSQTMSNFDYELKSQLKAQLLDQETLVLTSDLERCPLLRDCLIKVQYQGKIPADLSMVINRTKILAFEQDNTTVLYEYYEKKKCR